MFRENRNIIFSHGFSRGSLRRFLRGFSRGFPRGFLHRWLHFCARISARIFRGFFFTIEKLTKKKSSKNPRPDFWRIFQKSKASRSASQPASPAVHSTNQLIGQASRPANHLANQANRQAGCCGQRGTVCQQKTLPMKSPA